MRISDWSSDVCSSDLIGELVAPHVTRTGGEHHVVAVPACLVLGQRQDGGDAFAGFDGQQVDERLAARGRRADRQRSEERRVGKEYVSTCRSRWARYH